VQPKLRICVSDDEQDMRDFFAAALEHLGHEVVGIAKTGREFVKICQATQPDLLIADIRMPEMDGIEAAKLATQSRPAPVILVSGHLDDELRARALDDHVVAYLIKPIGEEHLKTTIPVAMNIFRRYLAILAEAELLKGAIHDRKVLERAKGIVMAHSGLNESDALHRLKKLALDRGQTLLQTAQMVVDAQKALSPPPPSAEQPKTAKRPRRRRPKDK